MKIIQIIVTEKGSRFNGAILGLGDDGKVYTDGLNRDRYGAIDVYTKLQWKEVEIKPPE